MEEFMFFLDRITQIRKVYVDSIDLSEIPQNWLCRCVVHNAIVKKEHPIQLWSTAQENNALQISWQQAQALLYRSLIDYSIEGLIHADEEDISFIFEDKANLVTFGFFIESGNDQLSENIKQFVALIKAQQIAPIQRMVVYVVGGNDLEPDDYWQIAKEIKSLELEISIVKIGLAFDEALDDKSEIKVIFYYI